MCMGALCRCQHIYDVPRTLNWVFRVAKIFLISIYMHKIIRENLFIFGWVCYIDYWQWIYIIIIIQTHNPIHIYAQRHYPIRCWHLMLYIIRHHCRARLENSQPTEFCKAWKMLCFGLLSATLNDLQITLVVQFSHGIVVIPLHRASSDTLNMIFSIFVCCVMGDGLLRI